jgi:hypothetical protein
MNYFEYHGSAFYDDERLNILKNATFCQDIMRITQYEPLANQTLDKSDPNYYTGKFSVREITNSWHFVYDNKLYCFWSDMYGRIDTMCELNTSKEKCLSGECGCYYEFNHIEDKLLIN